MSIYETKIVNYCTAYRECGKALARLYRLPEEEWMDIMNLRNICGIDTDVWLGFTARCGVKYGAGIIETQKGVRNHHASPVLIRLVPDKRENVETILRKLYGDDF